MSTTYRVALRIPSDWPDLSGTEGSRPPTFFNLGAFAGGDSVSEFCRQQAAHRLRPYGSAPTFTDLSAGGQPACIIEPSADQVADFRGMGELVVRYPSPLVLPTGEYKLFAMTARVPEIRAIAATLAFTSG